MDTSAPDREFLARVPDSVFTVTPAVAGRTDLDAVLLVDNTPYSFHCCTGEKHENGLYFTAPDSLHVDFIGVVTSDTTYVVDSMGLSEGCETIVSPRGHGIWTTSEWLDAYRA